MRVWLALGIFTAMHVLSVILVIRASRKSNSGHRRVSWRYLLVGDVVSRSVLTPEGLRLASIARRISWLAFLISAVILLFS